MNKSIFIIPLALVGGILFADTVSDSPGTGSTVNVYENGNAPPENPNVDFFVGDPILFPYPQYGAHYGQGAWYNDGYYNHHYNHDYHNDHYREENYRDGGHHGGGHR